MSGELMTVDKLQEQLELFYNTKVYPYLNGAAHDGLRTVGEIIPMHSETCPAHCLPCDGSTYNKADYPQLSALLLSLTTHSQYEVDGDSTKFKVPDYRGEFIRGTGTNSHENQGNGADVGVHQDGTKIPYFAWNSGNSTPCKYEQNLPTNADYESPWTTTSGGRRLFSSSQVASSDSKEHYTSRPTNTSVLFCIVYENHYIDAKHNYSTQEHVVGTWIDGKPLYEAVLDYQNIIISSDTRTWITLDNTYIDANNIDSQSIRIINSQLFNGTEVMSLPVLDYSSELLRILDVQPKMHQTPRNLALLANNMSYLSGCDIRIIIQYTKTTDTV